MFRRNRLTNKDVAASMIVRALDPAAAGHCEPVISPPGFSCSFGRIPLLRFTSSQLREIFSIDFAETDVTTAFELAAALKKAGRASAGLRNDRIARVVQQHDLLPCFVGYQNVTKGGVLPFITDGPSGKWSLFFEADGSMTLVRWIRPELQVVREPDLLGERKPATAVAPIGAKAFLLAGFESAKKVLTRSGA